MPDNNKALPGLTLGALGVVFGDIGTNPLYAIRQCVENLGAQSIQPQAVLGILSLIFWSLIIVVCIKYVGLILRADHDGEGGTLALLALIRTKLGRDIKARPDLIMLMVFFGSSLLYGDGVITPAISVLSAVEGVKLIIPISQTLTVAIAFVILAILFAFQHRGTAQIGACFGPIMTLWFVVIGIIGAVQIVIHPQVLEALNPWEGMRFLGTHGWTGMLVLGGVVLCFSGAEALFADLGHFGRIPITLAWYAVVLPSLLLSYFGEGAFLMDHPAAYSSPFYSMLPHWALIPMVILSTVATVIASQALISGVFSLTQQAISMGFFPRLKITHTSEEERGQVYVAVANYLLMFACLAVVVTFQTSDSLGNAYGLSVIGTMTITSLIYFVVLRRVYDWNLYKAAALIAGFLFIDLLFLAGNIVKIFSGAWVPIAVAIAVFAVFWAWTEGRSRYLTALDKGGMPLKDFACEMKSWEGRHPGTTIFLGPNRDVVPLVGGNSWIRLHARNEQVVHVVVQYENTPFVTEENRVKVEQPDPEFFLVTASFGFLQEPDIEYTLSHLPEDQLQIDRGCRVFYLPDPAEEVSGSWFSHGLVRAFQILRRNSLSTAAYYKLPLDQVVHVGVILKI